MDVYFDEQEVNYGPDKYGKPTPNKKVVMFHLKRPSVAGASEHPTTFDGVATEEHKHLYKDAWKTFEKKSKLDHPAHPEHAAKEDTTFLARKRKSE